MILYDIRHAKTACLLNSLNNIPDPSFTKTYIYYFIISCELRHFLVLAEIFEKISLIIIKNINGNNYLHRTFNAIYFIHHKYLYFYGKTYNKKY